ncbi:MAG: right-handed parallel beta-helix repeat-containing protein, partial [Thermoleophilaceae bacterium]|nr:right-handed parallel beta-helix repeat-containing protein [Thermoleophilaceae bacterium]
MNRSIRRRWPITIVAVLASLVLPAVAFAHLERPSYWPDPSPDTAVNPPAGGEVPKLRSLESAVYRKGPGRVRVVCQGYGGLKSLQYLAATIAKARFYGYRVRPSQPRIFLSRHEARDLYKLNRKLAKKCRYKEIQPAVTASHNNDRVVVMPGRYTEPTSRAAPLNDPRCADLTQTDSGGAKTPSYRYQVTCPNDQNLVHVAGRAVADAPPPQPPLASRQGIPDLGPCVRCNLQLEGSGVSPTDVIVDGASDYESNDVEARPRTLNKHVIIRVDRADGFVVHNLTARGALEHGIYVEETDGYRIDRVKMFWAADYGNLTFTSDHGLYQNCDGFGAGDAVLYPGAAPETGEQADLSFYPDAPRINTTVRKCDMRGSVLAYSGSMGNAVRITNNHIYNNTAGISTDTVSAAGHPGFPADSVEVDHNYIYSNNLDLFKPNPPVEPVIGVIPVGVGIFWAGHNNGRVHDNWIWDNWRHGAFLLSVPDFVVTPEGAVNPGGSCVNPILSTSCGNRYYRNHMGQVPRDFRPFPALYEFGNNVGPTRGSSPNGNDFWWDEGNLGTVVGNCWFENTGSDGTAASVTGPGVGAGIDVLPSNCATSLGTGDTAKLQYLLSCLLARDGVLPPERCDWYTL